MAFPASDALVTAMEARLGRRLPEPHRQRLIRENGGEVAAAGDIWTLHPVWDPTDRRTMGRTASHLVRENEVLRIDLPDALPEGWIAVAENDEGDLLVPRARRRRHPAWDHETGTLTPVTVDWATNGG